jgi:hypothetical protein
MEIIAVFDEPGYHDDEPPSLGQGDASTTSPPRQQQQDKGGRHTEKVVNLMGEVRLRFLK